MHDCVVQVGEICPVCRFTFIRILLILKIPVRVPSTASGKWGQTSDPHPPVEILQVQPYPWQVAYQSQYRNEIMKQTRRKTLKVTDREDMWWLKETGRVLM